jgi:hypothetical protein
VLLQVARTRQDSKKDLLVHQDSRHLLLTSLNPVPNAQVCVYLTVHITKLELQTTFSKPLYIPHSACIHLDLAAENLDVCTACDPWDSNIQLTMVKDRRPGLGMPFLDSHIRRGEGVIYFCQGFLPCMMPSMDGWWDGWMEKASRPRRPLLYVISAEDPSKCTYLRNLK